MTQGAEGQGADRQRREVLKSSLAIVAAASLNAGIARAATSPIVQTQDGKVRGFEQAGIFSFLGIPYGAPTSGRNRFMPPQKPARWSDVRDVLEYGPVSPQTPANAPPPRGGALANLHAAPKAGESEDCLNLNVWTPGIDRARRAVMVWIHGGGYFSGSGSMEVYSGAKLAQRGDVVVINITHRLNVLGYLYLGEAGGSAFAHSGIVGILDLVQALQWVRDNVAAFGGDPHQVMIFGESGGGGKVSTLMAMPQARGLFQRAAIQSGATIFLPERPEANDAAQSLLSDMGQGADAVHALQDMPLPQLMAGYFHWVAKWPEGPIGLAPVVDADVLPAQPCYPAAPRYSRDIPLLMGSNLSESAYMWMNDPTVFAMDDTALRARLIRILSATEMERAAALYRHDFPTATPSDLWILINSERSMRKNTLRMADARAVEEAAPTYLYHFRFPTPYMDGKLGTPHFLDVPLIFQNYGLPGVNEFTGQGERVTAMAATMSDAWIAFAKTGSPQTHALPVWKPYSLKNRETMILNEVSRLENDPDRARRRFWETDDYQII